MPGNRQIYDQAMQMGHSAAWDQEWDKAIAAYGRAVQELPDDPAAHNSLGLALLNARRLEDALKVYTRAHQLAPEDPIPLEKSADVLERLGRKKEAAQQYVNVAEVYLAGRDLEKAIGNWERATRLNPALVQINQRLALAYERTGQKKSAIREYLVLAAAFQRGDRSDLAVQAVQRALRIDPNHPQALNTLQALQSGVMISPDFLQVSGDEPSVTQRAQARGDTSEFDIPLQQVGESNPLGPLGEAIDLALEALANYVFESSEVTMGGAQAIQAIDLHRQGLIAEASGAYERALAGQLRHPGVYLNLGALQLELERFDAAIQSFNAALSDSRLAAGALHGLSKAYRAKRQPRASARNLLMGLQRIDVALALSPEEAEQIAATYQKLLDSVDHADEIMLQRLVESFQTRLTGPDWRQRVARVRRQLEEEITVEKPEDLIETMIYIDDQVTEGLTLIDRYMRQGMYHLAMDQAHFILQSAPDFLPVHQRIGQILLERNNIPEAMGKYNLIAQTYELRGDLDRAVMILEEALKIAPMDVDLHRSLITLFEQQGRREDLLEQHIDLADAHYQLGDLDTARSTYEKAIGLAERQAAPQERLTLLMHRLAEIDVQRLDLRTAMRTYELIRKLAPEDERARRALIDLNYRLNDPLSAIRELDGLLRVYARDHRAADIIRVLEEQVLRYPKDMGLRSRLAAVYRQTGNTPKSIHELDTLAELQLQAGLHDDAVVTIRRIISMNPSEIGDYQKLLQQLSG